MQLQRHFSGDWSVSIIRRGDVWMSVLNIIGGIDTKH